MTASTIRPLIDAILTDWPPASDSPVARPVAILYENDAWTATLFAALEQRGIPFVPVDLGANDTLPAPGDYALVFNRVSPSSDERGHGPAIDRARAWLAAADVHGTPVINGADAFEVETSKLEQYALIRGLGLHVPRTTTLDRHDPANALDDDFPFPAILKPDRGGSGAGVQFIGSRSHLRRVHAETPSLFESDNVMLLQEFVSAPDQTIMRLEFVGDELVQSMRVLPVNTYNLCPADGCDRAPADGASEAGALFTHVPDLPETVIAEARGIVRAARLEVGGVEYIETADGTRHYYDINATSVYRDDIATTAGIDPMRRLVTFIARRAAGVCAARCAA